MNTVFHASPIQIRDVKVFLGFLWTRRSNAKCERFHPTKPWVVLQVYSVYVHTCIYVHTKLMLSLTMYWQHIFIKRFRNLEILCKKEQLWEHRKELKNDFLEITQGRLLNASFSLWWCSTILCPDNKTCNSVLYFGFLIRTIVVLY